MLYIKIYIKRLLLILVYMLIYEAYILAQTNVPQKERRIYLWDVSGSLLSEYETIDSYNGQHLPTYKLGNGLWNKLKESLVNSIEQLEDNPQNEIIVIPFYDDICEVIQDQSTKIGKRNVISRIKAFEYNVRGGRTDLIKPLQAFESIVKQDCYEYINYMFFYTDGAHETIKNIPEFDCRKVIERINQFNDFATDQNNYIYRFYYLVSPIADKFGNIQREEADWKKFWVIDDINIKIKFIGLDNIAINYNVCDNPSEGIVHDSYKNICLTKDGKHFNGDISFDVSNNEYYFVDCVRSNDDSTIIVKVNIREGIDKEKLPKRSSIKVNLRLNRTKDEHRYYYLLDQYFYIHCINTPERRVSLSLKNTKGDKSTGAKRLNLGNTSYYPSFFGKSSRLDCLDFSLITDFDKFAVQDKACLNVSFADSEGKPLTYTNFKIVVNKSDTLSMTKCYCCIESGQEQVDFKILPSETTGDYNFKGYLIVSQVNNIDRINGETISNDMVRILPWGFEHDRKLNPLLKNILLGILLFFLLIVAAIILNFWMWCWGPKFPWNWDIKFESNKIDNPTITFDCPKGRDYIFKGSKIFTHAANIFFSRNLYWFRINKVVLCNNTFKTWSYKDGYSIYIRTNFNNNHTIRINSLTFTPSKTKGTLANVKVEYTDGCQTEEKLIYKNCPNETNRIGVDYINVDIFGKKHNN